MSNRQQCNDFSNYPSTDARSFDPVLVNGRGIYSDVSKGEPITSSCSIFVNSNSVFQDKSWHSFT